MSNRLASLIGFSVSAMAAVVLAGALFAVVHVGNLAGVKTVTVADSDGGHHTQLDDTSESDVDRRERLSRADNDRFAPAKPMSVVHFVRPARYQANSGETLEVSLTVAATEDIQNVTIEARADSGLMLSRSTRHSVGRMHSGQEAGATFTVITLAEGRHYVNVVATADLDGSRNAASYAIPIEVGNVADSAKRKSLSRVITDSDGNRLILMEADAPAEGGQSR